MSVGIDFGTTNTAAVRCSGGVAEEIGDETRQPLPSIVAINKFTGEVEVGRSARRRVSSEDEDGSWIVIRSLKRELAQNTQWNVDGRIYTAVDATAEVLRRIAARPESWGGQRIEKATLGVPVRMPAVARRRLRSAASLANIEVTAVLKESTAACVKHRALLGNLQHAAVFDWGGGTLDISVVRVDGRELTELWSDGRDLAGDDLDRIIARHILARCQKENESVPDFEQLTKTLQLRLLYEAERAKQVLGRDSEHEVFVDVGGAGHAVTVRQSEVERELRPLVREAIDFLAGCITRARLAFDEVDLVLLVGGSSQLPLLSRMLDEDARFQGRFEQPGTPQWDVAHGAAILDGARDGAYVLSDRISLLLADGSAHCIVDIGAQPIKRANSLFLSLVDNNESATLIFRQGDIQQPLLYVTVPTIGFDEEELRVEYRLTEEWTFHVTGWSASLGEKSKSVAETEEVKFRYVLPAIERQA